MCFGGASVLASRLVSSLAPNMPPRTGLHPFAVTFYNDAAPTAL